LIAIDHDGILLTSEGTQAQRAQSGGSSRVSTSGSTLRWGTSPRRIRGPAAGGACSGPRFETNKRL